MTTAEKAKEAVLERVAELAETAEINDLFALTDTIGRITGESTKHLNAFPEILATLLAGPAFGTSKSEPKNKEVKK